MRYNQPQLRRLITIGTPLLTLILLLFHPRPGAEDMAHVDHTGVLDTYAFLASVADRFVVVHVLFAPLLALLGLSIFLLLADVRRVAATLSRVSAFVFALSYIMYETIIGTATALLARDAAGLPAGEQAVIGDAITRILGDPVLGDPSVLYGVASLSWPAAVIAAAVAFRREGKPLLPCILLGLSSIFFSHASVLGLAGMLLFLVAVLGLERAASPVGQVQAGVTNMKEVTP